ncbi:transporter [Lithospermum erythrorhizon]|uniref:Transporter n=1 Tax=Lithospermum erythrorhizon TaxID=34254 RepID=A0AAV3RLS1_LITER
MNGTPAPPTGPEHHHPRTPPPPSPSGELSLAGGALGFTFANVTGFSILNGLSGAMEPICGQAFGAKNFRFLHKTLVMAICLLLVILVPIAFLWLKVDKILIVLNVDKILVSKKI